MKRALVQILVVVANIQMRTLKTEVEKDHIRIIRKLCICIETVPMKRKSS
eukprot:COSAG02_NODE_73578_length_169_cov_1367.314286_1_plen_49_part_10